MNLYFIDGVLITTHGLYNLIKYNSIKKTITYINNVYTLNFIERLLLYWFVNILLYNSIFCFLFVIPSFQNWLIDSIYDTYQQEKSKLIKFIISKRIIQYFQKLFHISNYQIFKVYPILCYDFYIKILQNSLFIFIIYLLKQSERTYLYYRIIKYHAFISSYYTFTISNIEQAKEILHDMILDNRWDSLSDIEIVHALFILIHKQLMTYLPSTSDSLYTKLQFLYFKLWIPYYIYSIGNYLDFTFVITILLYLQFRLRFNVLKYIIAMLIPNTIMGLSIIYFYNQMLSIMKDVSFYFTYKQEIDKVIMLQKRIN